MKIFYACFFSLLTCSFCVGQNPLFFPFGQTSSEIKAKVDTKEYIKRVSYEEKLIESVINFQRQVRYHLKEDILFAVEDERLVLDKKQAEQTIESVLAYMENSELKPRILNNKNGITHYAAVRSDRLIEFIVHKKKVSKKMYEYTLKLKATSRHYGPRSKTEAMVATISELK